MNEKGLLTKKMENQIAAWLDDQLKLNGVFEMIDGVGIKLIITQLDNTYGEKIKEPYKTKISETISVVFEEKDATKALTISVNFLDEIIDVPYLDDESEKLLFQGLLTILLTVLSKILPEE